jgi:hypothetical protein
MRRRSMLDQAVSPALLHRIESLVVLTIAVGTYARHDGSWVVFIVLFLAPDLSFLASLAGPRVAAAGYNLAHVYVFPGLLLAIGAGGSRLAVDLALIWGAHIALDRVLGYGLRYPETIKETHLGRIGRR